MAPLQWRFSLSLAVLFPYHFPYRFLVFFCTALSYGRTESLAILRGEKVFEECARALCMGYMRT